MSEPAPSPQTTTTSSAAAARSVVRRKPRISLVIATAFGLGYIPLAPGTFGSLAGAAICIAMVWLGAPHYWQILLLRGGVNFWTVGWTPSRADYMATLIIAVVGIYVADQISKTSGAKDPQIVVIDEVSGQMVAYFFPLTVLNWKSWLLGFILFRVFDIWKPFPARQAESLPGGLGIMADDWIAGVYAALGLWIARALGL
jgi:phosphatidylglycerophosphatase A